MQGAAGGFCGVAMFWGAPWGRSSRWLWDHGGPGQPRAVQPMGSSQARLYPLWKETSCAGAGSFLSTQPHIHGQAPQNGQKGTLQNTSVEAGKT